MSAYFDNAATTYPKPEEVYTFMDRFYRENGGNAGRGQYKLAGEASRVIHQTRQLLLKLLSCENKELVFAPSATIAMNMVLQGSINDNVKTVYVSPFEHNAVTRILHSYENINAIEVIKLPLAYDFSYDMSKIESAFFEKRPDLVVVSHASNVCGLIAPVSEIMHLAKMYEAITVVDMAQTAGLVGLNVGSEDIDYAIFAGHKTLYGPIGIGGFIKKPHLKPVPVLFGGTGVESAKQDMPDSSPSRYEMGSQDIHAISGLYAAVKWFTDHEDEIRTKEAINHNRLLELLCGHDNIRIVGPKNRSNCIGVVSCVFDGYSSDNIGDVLDGFEIAVRTGLHCSPLAHKTLGTFPAGTVRFSVGYFTGDEEFYALKEALDYIEENS